MRVSTYSSRTFLTRARSWQPLAVPQRDAPPAGLLMGMASQGYARLHDMHKIVLDVARRACKHVARVHAPFGGCAETVAGNGQGGPKGRAAHKAGWHNEKSFRQFWCARNVGSRVTRCGECVLRVAACGTYCDVLFVVFVLKNVAVMQRTIRQLAQLVAFFYSSLRQRGTAPSLLHVA